MDSTNCASSFQHHQGSEYLEMNALKKSVEIDFFTHIKGTINIRFCKVELCRHEFLENMKESHSRQQEIKHKRALMPNHV